MNATIVLLTVVAFVVVAVMTVTGPLLPLIAEEYGRTVGQAGIIVTAFAVPYGACQIVFGPIGDRHGKLRVVALGTATISSSPADSPVSGSPGVDALRLGFRDGCDHSAGTA